MKMQQIFVPTRSIALMSSTLVATQYTPNGTISTDPSLDGSPQWMQKVISKVVSQEELEWSEKGKYRTRVLT
jgi:hypothetical protein